MTPLDILTREHRVILQVLSCMEAMAAEAETAGRLDAEAARQATSFLREFADRSHHGKEEERLFPMMEANGMPAEGGPTGVMRMEHNAGRALVTTMVAQIDAAADGDGDALQAFNKACRDFVTLLRDHIDKEDHCLFPMAERALGHEGMEELGRTFDQVQAEYGDAIKVTYLKVAESLARRFGVEAVAY